MALLRRLRHPRYAAGFVAGLAYLGWFGWFIFGPSPDGPDPARLSAVVEFGLPPLLAALALGWWVSGRTHMALAFTPPEVQFYFQAPVARRTLLHYKLLKAQATLLPLAGVFAASFGVMVSLPFMPTAVSVWGLMTVGHLHQLTSGLLRASWRHQGRASLRRQWLPLAALVGAGAGMAWALWPLAGAFRAAEEPAQVLWALQAALGHPAAALVLTPFHVAVAPLVATDMTAWVVGMAGLLALAALHYTWLMRIDTAFEELAAEAGVELQAIQQAFKEGRLGAVTRDKSRPPKRPWFRLRPEGHPAVAVFWKNFTAFTRTLSVGQLLTLPVTFFAVWVILMFATDDPNEAVLAAASIPALLIPLALLMGPTLIRNDLRTDFQRLEIVRTWPLAGRDLVAAEVAAGAASLTLVVLYFAVTALAILLLGNAELPYWWLPWAGMGAAVVVLPLVCAISVGIQNVMAVNFPAWIQFGPTQQQGLDQMGGTIVVMLLTGLALGLALLLPVGFAFVLGMRLFLVMGEAALWPALGGFWLAMAGEVLILVTLLGEAYEEMDPSEEGLLG